MSITASNNPFPHDPNENFGDKLDRGGYPLTAQDLKNDIDAIAKPDGFLKIGVINKVGNAVTIDENEFEYRIDQIEVENQAFSTTIAAATDGYRRIDIIVGLKSGSFVKIQGVESIDSAQEPQVPDETIKLTSFNVFGSDISYPNNPIEGSQYVQKSERNSVYLTGSGVINQWDMVDEKATIVFNGTITRLNTVSYSSVPYAGKTIRLFNAQSTPVIIGNSVSGYGVDFVFSDGQDYVLQPNQTIEFSFDITYAPYAHHMFIGSMGITNWSELQGKPSTFPPSAHTHAISDVTGLQGELDSRIIDSQIEIGSNSSINNTWNGKTILFTANCTITVPSTLLSQYGFVFRTLAGVTVTWAITAPFTWETTPTTTPEKTTGSFMRRGGTNTILLDF